ncbi:hypothetical protein DFJ73DRAFT_806931 [Zopfochytrium polystomum]|nr:hypothetical protein DFJ73DRAFT_806931 [Zopfochytrium polystomum]
MSQNPAVDKPIADPCLLCGEQPFKYVCPRCNVKYCSVACYKCEAHRQCSETFYRDNVMAELGDQTAPEQVQKSMKAILRRFAAENTVDTLEDEVETNQSDAVELEQSLAELDIDSANSEDLLKLLTPQEQTEFEAALAAGRIPRVSDSNLLDVPTSGESPAASAPDQLLAVPWWRDSDSVGGFAGGDGDVTHPTALPPVPDNLLQGVAALLPKSSSGPNPSLSFHVIDLLMTYVLTWTHCNGELGNAEGDSEPTANPAGWSRACDVAWAVSWTLSDRGGFVYGGVEEAVTTVKMRAIEVSSLGFNSQLMASLLDDVVAILTTTDSFLLRALGDLERVFSEPTASKEHRRKSLMAAKKVHFFACLCNDPSFDAPAGPVHKLRAALEAVRSKARKEASATQAFVKELEKRRSVHSKSSPKATRPIEEL